MGKFDTDLFDLCEIFRDQRLTCLSRIKNEDHVDPNKNGPEKLNKLKQEFACLIKADLNLCDQLMNLCHEVELLKTNFSSCKVVYNDCHHPCDDYRDDPIDNNFFQPITDPQHHVYENDPITIYEQPKSLSIDNRNFQRRNSIRNLSSYKKMAKTKSMMTSRADRLKNKIFNFGNRRLSAKIDNRSIEKIDDERKPTNGDGGGFLFDIIDCGSDSEEKSIDSNSNMSSEHQYCNNSNKNSDVINFSPSMLLIASHKSQNSFDSGINLSSPSDD